MPRNPCWRFKPNLYSSLELGITKCARSWRGPRTVASVFSDTTDSPQTIIDRSRLRPKGLYGMLLIKNGRVLDPARKTDAALDVLLDGEKITEVAPAGKISAGNAEIFDATGLIVAPGFIDLHAHLREPGQESSETIETGTRAAAH